MVDEIQPDFFTWIVMEKWHCARCNHTWLPREKNGEEPLKCPSCNSPYWDIERRGWVPHSRTIWKPVLAFLCIRCKGAWVPKNPNRPPRKCSLCGSTYWKRLRKHHRNQEEEE